jgi:peptide/nickel transport system substrate-binding protein
MLSRRMLARLAGPVLALPALPAAAQPRAGTLRVVSPWEIGGLDPARSGYIFARMQVAETLVTTDRDNTLAPLLARGWRVDANGLT